MSNTGWFDREEFEKWAASAVWSEVVRKIVETVLILLGLASEKVELEDDGEGKKIVVIADNDTGKQIYSLGGVGWHALVFLFLGMMKRRWGDEEKRLYFLLGQPGEYDRSAVPRFIRVLGAAIRNIRDGQGEAEDGKLRIEVSFSPNGQNG